MSNEPHPSTKPVLERRPDGELIVVTGRSGSGKTLYTMQQTARASRLLVWDSHLQWSMHGCARVKTFKELAAVCGTRSPGHYAYVGRFSRHTFALFCMAAACWVMLAPATIVVEELADVTHPGKACDQWGELIRRVRKYGGTLYGITQRPAESDKTLIGNAHRIVCHAMGRVADAKYMAAEMRVPLAAVESLNFDQCEHLERLANYKTRRGFAKKPSRRV